MILVGDNAASQVYVRNKVHACAEIGIESQFIGLPSDTPQSALLQRVDELNNEPKIDGILIQLPLPAHIDIRAVLERISIEKDVDGFICTMLVASSPATPSFRRARPTACKSYWSTKRFRWKAATLSSSAPATSSASRWR